jgi:hypothetical protein
LKRDDVRRSSTWMSYNGVGGTGLHDRESRKVNRNRYGQMLGLLEKEKMNSLLRPVSIVSNPEVTSCHTGGSSTQIEMPVVPLVISGVRASFCFLVTAP